MDTLALLYEHMAKFKVALTYIHYMECQAVHYKDQWQCWVETR